MPLAQRYAIRKRLIASGAARNLYLKEITAWIQSSRVETPGLWTDYSLLQGIEGPDDSEP